MASSRQSPPFSAGSRHGGEFKFTSDEMARLSAAMKDEHFVKLLAEYARELSDPEKKAEYESEIMQLERERGFEVSFIHPKPGYVIKVEEKESRRKIFINICSEPQIGAPASVSTSQGGQTGLKWSIPYSMSKPRDDTDRSGGGCVVYDAIFHPDTLYLASRDARIKNLVHNTAFDALKSTFNVVVDTEQVKYPKMKFKGLFHPTVIRKPVSSKQTAGMSSETTTSSSSATTSSSVTTSSSSTTTTTPGYEIKYRSETDLQDHLVHSTGVGSTRPKQIVVEINLPLLESAANLDLDVQEQSLSLTRDVAPCHKLDLQLPFPVDENSGNAKFDKSRRCLVVTLPVRPAPAPSMKTERLSSNDSGIEEDAASVVNAVLPSLSAAAEKSPSPPPQTKQPSPPLPTDGKSSVTRKGKGRGGGKQSDKINKVEGYRTGKRDVTKPFQNDTCDNVDTGKDEAVVLLQGDADGAEATSPAVSDGEVSVKDRTLGFLDGDLSYCLPAFTHTVLDNIMILTLEVKNVSESTVMVKLVEDWKSLHLKFTSIGAGHFPVHHAFYLDFLQAGSICGPEQVSTECWDNNLVIQLPWTHAMAEFRVGLASTDLKDKVHTVQKSAPMELDLKTEDTVSSKHKKYMNEKHPKLMKKESPQKKEDKVISGMDIKSNNNSLDDQDSNNTGSRERHSSGESLDSSMSMSPYDTVLLEQQHDNHMKQLQQLKEEQGETAAESDGDDPQLVLTRSMSTEEMIVGRAVKPRSILKRRSAPTLVGSRFRCYSESCVDNLGASSGHLASGLSESAISEEGEASGKKTVRFNDKIQQQLYRVNSCIIAKTAKNRKKAEKKRRAVERRLSEGDSVELKNILPEPIIPKGGSLDSNTWDQESHEDSGLSSSFEETMVISGGGQEQSAASDKVKNKKRTKRRTKTFEMSNDLIFDLDI